MEALDVPLFIHPRSPEADQVRAFKGCEELLGKYMGLGLCDRDPRIKNGV